jgi:hypothetical protein
VMGVPIVWHPVPQVIAAMSVNSPEYFGV